jgi:2-C-methyl-D-erythritol 4-phosphate cytidylyltransferase
MNTAIIVAAGSGSRIDAANPKQFLLIHGKPIVVHTLERFEKCAAIDQIVLVLPEAEIERFQKVLDGSSISKLARVVVGGDTRAKSVKAGLDAVDAATHIVAVHDGARPLVTVEEIQRTVDVASTSGAACLVTAVSDTIKRVDEDRIVTTLDRSKLRRALTPQAFKFDILMRASQGAVLDETVTDECMLVEKLGLAVSIVEGSGHNIKITHPEDLVLAEALMSTSNYTAGRT